MLKKLGIGIGVFFAVLVIAYFIFFLFIFSDEDKLKEKLNLVSSADEKIELVNKMNEVIQKEITYSNKDELERFWSFSGGFESKFNNLSEKEKNTPIEFMKNKTLSPLELVKLINTIEKKISTNICSKTDIKDIRMNELFNRMAMTIGATVDKSNRCNGHNENTNEDYALLQSFDTETMSTKKLEYLKTMRNKGYETIDKTLISDLIKNQKHIILKEKEEAIRIAKEQLDIAKSYGFNNYKELIKDMQIAKDNDIDEKEYPNILKEIRLDGFKNYEQFLVIDATKDKMDAFNEFVNRMDRIYAYANELNKPEANSDINKEVSKLNKETFPYGFVKWNGTVMMSSIMSGQFKISIDMGDYVIVVENSDNFFNTVKNKNIKNGQKVYFAGKIKDVFPKNMIGLNNQRAAVNVMLESLTN